MIEWFNKFISLRWGMTIRQCPLKLHVRHQNWYQGQPKDWKYWNDFEFWQELDDFWNAFRDENIARGAHVFDEMIIEWKQYCFQFDNHFPFGQSNEWKSCVLMNFVMLERISCWGKHEWYMEITKPYQTWTGNHFFWALVESIF